MLYIFIQKDRSSRSCGNVNLEKSHKEQDGYDTSQIWVCDDVIESWNFNNNNKYSIREYKSVWGYVKQMREKTEKIKITDKTCLDREQYGKKLKETKVLVENKEKREGYCVDEGKEAKARRNDEKTMG